MTNKGMTTSSSTFQRHFILFILVSIMLLSTLPLLSGKETVSFQTTGATIAQYSAVAFGNSDNNVCAGAATVPWCCGPWQTGFHALLRLLRVLRRALRPGWDAARSRRDASRGRSRTGCCPMLHRRCG